MRRRRADGGEVSLAAQRWYLLAPIVRSGNGYDKPSTRPAGPAQVMKGVGPSDLCSCWRLSLRPDGRSYRLSPLRGSLSF
jgi:hypothetical protein